MIFPETDNYMFFAPGKGSYPRDLPNLPNLPKSEAEGSRGQFKINFGQVRNHNLPTISSVVCSIYRVWASWASQKHIPPPWECKQEKFGQVAIFWGLRVAQKCLLSCPKLVSPLFAVSRKSFIFNTAFCGVKKTLSSLLSISRCPVRSYGNLGNSGWSKIKDLRTHEKVR